MIFSYDQRFRHELYNKCIELGHCKNRTMVYHGKPHVYCNKCQVIFSILNGNTLIFRPRFVNANAKLILYNNQLCFAHINNRVQIIKSIHNLQMAIKPYYKFGKNRKNNQHAIIQFTPKPIMYYIKWPSRIKMLMATDICDMFAIFTYRKAARDAYLIIYKLIDLKPNIVNDYYMKIQATGFHSAKCKVNNGILYILTGGEMIHIDIATKQVLRHIDRYDCVFMFSVIDFDFKPNGDIVFVYSYYQHITLLEHNVDSKKHRSINLLYERQLFTN